MASASARSSGFCSSHHSSSTSHQRRKFTDPRSLGQSLNNVLSFNETLSLPLQYWTQLGVSLGAISRTREFTHRTPTEPNPLSPISLLHNWPAHSSIETRNLGASYTSPILALDNTTLFMHTNEKIGFCDRSDSGKSSLLSCLLRLLEAPSGPITIDSIELSNIEHHTLRERLLTVPQDAFLTQHTIRYNLDPLTQYTDAQIIAGPSSPPSTQSPPLTFSPKGGGGETAIWARAHDSPDIA